ncbi:hypothetical protein BH10PSE1_BH10PSE1_13420 [soil metagenome]
MPRYFFDTKDGRRVHDAEGAIFKDAKAARQEGLTVLGEILRDQGESFWDTGRFSIIVTDETGGPVVTLTATASDAAEESAEVGP